MWSSYIVADIVQRITSDAAKARHLTNEVLPRLLTSEPNEYALGRSVTATDADALHEACRLLASRLEGLARAATEAAEGLRKRHGEGWQP